VTRSGAPCRRTARESNLRAGASAPWCESAHGRCIAGEGRQHAGVLGGVGELALVDRHCDLGADGDDVVDGVGQLEPRTVDGDCEDRDWPRRQDEGVARVEELTLADEVGEVGAAGDVGVHRRMGSAADVDLLAGDDEAVSGGGDRGTEISELCRGDVVQDQFG